MLQAAISQGIEKFGFSGHSYLDTGDIQIGIKNMDAYLAEVNRLKEKYKDQIKIYAGLEYDFFSDVDTSNLDYTIGSVHFVKKGGKYIICNSRKSPFVDYLDEYFDGDPYSYVEAYYDEVAEVKQRTNCDIVGHFDIVTKFNEGNAIFDTSHERYIKAWQRAADKIGCKDTLFEINFGAVNGGFRTECFPSKEIRDYLSQRGAKFIFNSDAHKTIHVGHIDIDESQFEGLKIVDSPI